MKFIETALPGAYVIEPELLEDERGCFARTWCVREFEEMGLVSSFVQSSIAFSIRKGTLRGMHFQHAPHEEVKLVRCTQGAIFDAIVDMRPGSSTFGRWIGVELSARNRRMLYVPEGFAHGYQTLEPDTEVSYQMSRFHAPQAAGGIRWDDPEIGIEWPEVESRTLSAKDRGGLPTLSELARTVGWTA